MVLRGAPGTMSSQTFRRLASFQKSVSKASACAMSSSLFDICWILPETARLRQWRVAVLPNLLYDIINYTNYRPPGNQDVQIEAPQYRRRRGDRYPHPCRRALRHARGRRL